MDRYKTDLKVLNEILGVLAQLAIKDGLPSPLQQQQLIKGLENVNAGLVNGAHNGAPCVDYVTHCSHHNGSRPCIQTCKQPEPLSAMMAKQIT